MTGEVLEVNGEALENPDIVNGDPCGGKALAGSSALNAAAWITESLTEINPRIVATIRDFGRGLGEFT